MLGPVSKVGFYEGYAALGAYTREGSAVSSAARIAREAACAVVGAAEQSQALFGEKATALSQLHALATESAEANWDGCQAAAIDEIAVMIAAAVIRSLPADLPMPEFAPEPDGSISLDWIASHSRLFSLSVGRNTRLAFAWLDGSSRGHGVERFDGNRLPARVLQGVRTILANA